MKNAKALSFRVLAFILVLTVVFSSSVLFAKAEDEGAYEFSYELETDGGITLTGIPDLTGLGTELVIPAEYEGYKVVGIADNAFENLGKADRKELALRSVDIADTVAFIGSDAFKGCDMIQEVVYSGNLTGIGSGAFVDTPWFQNYELDFIYLGDGKNLKFLIGYKGSDKNIVIPSTTVRIGDGAFEGNKNIESLVISERVAAIGQKAFYNCSNLKYVSSRGSVQYCGTDAFSGTAWLKDYAGEFIFFGDTLIKYVGKKEIVSIPNTFTSIADYAFEGNKSAKYVRIPTSIKTIGYKAFYLYTDNKNNVSTDKYTEIYCYEGSAGHKYALENNLTIAEKLYLPGDFNNDKIVTAADARSYLRFSAKLIQTKSYAVLQAGDMDFDGKVMANDARLILRLSAGLDYSSPEEYLTRPSTPFEILMFYSEILKVAARNEVGFDILRYQTVTDHNFNLNTMSYFTEFKNQLTPEKKAKSQTFAPSSVDALNSLYLCNLVDSGIIKSAKCVLNSSGKYDLTITFNNEVDVEGSDSLTSLIFPVDAREDFNKTLKSRWWYGLYGSSISYKLTYKDCELKAVIDRDTNMFESINMSMKYYGSEIKGRLGGITIKDGSGSEGGNATRQDKVSYSNFVY